MTEAPGGVAAVDRALSILAAFSDGTPALSLAELAQKTGLYKSTILRLITSLEEAGYLRRVGSKYQLGPQLLHLGSLYQQSFQLGDYLQPELEQLAAQSGESAAFYVRDGQQKICLYRVNATQHVVLRYIQTGYRTELATGASGQVLLAFTEPDPAEEYAAVRHAPLVVSLTRREAGSAAIACPVFGLNQDLQGALTLAGPLLRFGPEDIQRLAPQLLEAAIRVTRSLGGDPTGLCALRQTLPLTVV